MAKVRCKVCANELKGFCKIKKIGVKTNKPRLCEAYIYDEVKIKARDDIKVIRMGYQEQEEQRRRMKEELRELRRMLKEKPSQGTAKDLGLVKQDENNIILPGDRRFNMPSTDMKHPLTGDLSRFITNAEKSED